MAVSNVKAGYIDWTNVKTIEATKTEIATYQLKINDVLMAEGGDPDKVGRGALLTTVPKNCIHQNHVFRVRLNQLSPDMLCHLSMTKQLKYKKEKALEIKIFGTRPS
jgi:type I restriction enzyme S subunit